MSPPGTSPRIYSDSTPLTFEYSRLESTLPELERRALNVRRAEPRQNGL